MRLDEACVDHGIDMEAMLVSFRTLAIRASGLRLLFLAALDESDRHFNGLAFSQL
ncbi:MAG TPA: hypothetical protein VFI95_17930 [Terriglobales bacterium]|jgi:hypothetical protein|nr:hypothetical protein [Terriglobales bacterium]